MANKYLLEKYFPRDVPEEDLDEMRLENRQYTDTDEDDICKQEVKQIIKSLIYFFRILSGIFHPKMIDNKQTFTLKYSLDITSRNQNLYISYEIPIECSSILSKPGKL